MDGVDVESQNKKREYYKQWREKNKEKLKIKKKEYAEKNKNKIKEILRNYYLSNKERLKKLSKEYKEKNRKKINENTKRWRAKTKEIRSEYNKKLYYLHKEKHREYRMKNKQRSREYHYFYKYKITMDQYNNILYHQNNKCGICLIDLTILPRKHVHLDHCHETGKIRGILCNKCNSILGLAYDNPFILINASIYLNEYS